MTNFFPPAVLPPPFSLRPSKSLSVSDGVDGGGDNSFRTSLHTRILDGFILPVQTYLKAGTSQKQSQNMEAATNLCTRQYQQQQQDPYNMSNNHESAYRQGYGHANTMLMPMHVPAWSADGALPFDEDTPLFSGTKSPPQAHPVCRGWSRFRPANRYRIDTQHNVFDCSFDNATVKIENSPPALKIGVLEQDVDVSQYDYVANEELSQGLPVHGRDDFDDASSPSSVNTMGPFTPAACASSEAFTSHKLQPYGIYSARPNTRFAEATSSDSKPQMHFGAECSTAAMEYPRLASLPSSISWRPLHNQVPANASTPVLDGSFSTWPTSINNLHADGQLMGFRRPATSQESIQPVVTVYSNRYDNTDNDDPALSSLSSASSVRTIEHDHEHKGRLREQSKNEVAERRRRDEMLLDMRNRGVSYKDIRKRGGFREAESTLRGRVRVLTKAKSERVRKPEWNQTDIALLRRAVDEFTYRSDVGSPRYDRGKLKVPWKRVSLWVQEHGGSYCFAPATCSKKWEEVGEW